MATRIIMPALGLTAEQGTIVRWLKRVGERVEKDEPLLEIETEKATVEVTAPTSGVLREILAPEGATVPVTSLIGWIEEEAGPTSGRVKASPAAKRVAREMGIDLGTVTGSGPEGRVLEEDVRRVATGAPPPPRHVVTSVARRIAMERGVDLSSVVGTGPGGRITSADVLAAAEGTISSRERQAAMPVAADGGQLLPLGRVRRVTADRMAFSARSVARVTLLMQVDASEAVRFRRQLVPEFERRYSIHLTYDAMVVRAVALALREHPHLNAQWADGSLRLLPEINIGLAVALEDGLMVPVVHQADRKKLWEVAREVERLVERARQGKLSAEDITGGTFTVTNLGPYGVDAFTPIVNPPEAAILGVGAIAWRPVVVDGQVTARETVHLSLSFDHRVTDGVPAARFLARIREILESPYILVAE